MPRIELENLISGFAQCTPEQIILLKSFYQNFDYLPAGGGNRHIVNVEMLGYIGTQTASEFLTYAATKMYLAFEFEATNSAVSVGASGARITFHNAADTAYYYLKNTVINYNTATPAANYLNNNAVIKNIYFSRIVIDQFTHLRFMGFRITLD